MSKKIDFELAEDTKDLLKKNEDSKCIDLKISAKLYGFADSTLLKVTKSINSPIVIEDVEEISPSEFE